MINRSDVPLLSVRDLTVSFETHEGRADAVQNASFDLYPGETLGIVGESGCGKTVTALGIMRLIRPPGLIRSGEIIFRGNDLLSLSERQMRSVRGREISMVFQEPMTSLNPVFTIGDQVMEVLLFHERLSWNDAYGRCRELLLRVGLHHPDTVMLSYPHQLSGGMRQRVMIAIGLACNPAILIADEPTTAIDVTAQAQVLRLIDQLKHEFGMAVLLITHDLGVVAQTCDRVAIMYASRIVESGSVRDIFYQPKHPYTIGLLNSIPSMHSRGERLTIIPGQVPRATMYPAGCNFQSRCDFATETCILHEPDLRPLAGGQQVACWNWHAVPEFKRRNNSAHEPATR
jgi:peptide/nickel transport system ATP-binding protein